MDWEAGKMVKRGYKGWMVVGGYLICQGYLNQKEKTEEVMSVDAQGVRYMMTGIGATLISQDLVILQGGSRISF